MDTKLSPERVEMIVNKPVNRKSRAKFKETKVNPEESSIDKQKSQGTLTQFLQRKELNIVEPRAIDGVIQRKLSIIISLQKAVVTAMQCGYFKIC